MYFFDLLSNLAYNYLFVGEVLELADRHDLGSCAARREGSSPSFPMLIIILVRINENSKNLYR